jgi:hypothetical protein
MKKIFLLLFFFYSVQIASAKKVQFNVDMRYQTIDAFGVHVSGNFLTALGYTANWLSDSVQLTQVGSSSIYSTVVDLPAFQAYEYYYLNGKETYQVEFIPYESQVIFNFVTNRWFFLDSIANDTTILPAVIFSTNAPFGKTLIRHSIDMQNVPINPNGVHIATDADNYNYENKHMYSFDNKNFEYLTYVDSTPISTQKYKFANGNSVIDAESSFLTCFVNGYRNATASKDTIINNLCYNSCAACGPLAINDIKPINAIAIKTNPVSQILVIENLIDEWTNYNIFNMLGKKVHTMRAKGNCTIDVSKITPGNYILSATNTKSSSNLIWIKN